MPTPIYRAGKLGVELSESLNDMVEAQAVPSEMHEQVMQSFDKHLNEFLKDNWSTARIKSNQLQGRIENGVIRSYRNVNNTWEFELEQATFRGQAFDAAVRTSKDQGKLVKNIHVVIIDQKVAEAARPDSPARVKASAGAADADSAPAMTADSWEDWEDDQPPQQPSQPAGHVSVEQAQAQRQARAEEQAQAAAREQYAAANETSLALARGAGPSSQPPGAAADEDEDLDDWEAVENDDNPLDDKPANKKQKRGSEDAQDDFDFGDDLNSDDDGARPHRACIAPASRLRRTRTARSHRAVVVVVRSSATRARSMCGRRRGHPHGHRACGYQARGGKAAAQHRVCAVQKGQAAGVQAKVELRAARGHRHDRRLRLCLHQVRRRLCVQVVVRARSFARLDLRSTVFWWLLSTASHGTGEHAHCRVPAVTDATALGEG